MLVLTDEDRQVVARTPLFSGIEPGQLDTLIAAATLASFPEARLLFSQGDPADRFFVVLAGRVDLFALTEGGDQTIIEVFDAGWSFAEAAIFSSARFPLNGEAAAGTRLLRIPAAPFLARLSRHPQLAFKMLAALSRWQRHLVKEIGEIKSRSPVQRLGLFILQLAESEHGTAQVRLPLTKAVLASRIGIAPESLSRAMARLRPLGVATHGRDIVIADMDALRRFCEQGGLD